MTVETFEVWAHRIAAMGGDVNQIAAALQSCSWQRVESMHRRAQRAEGDYYKTKQLLNAITDDLAQR